MRLAYAAAPVFVARGRGTIINIASIVALAPELLNGVYAGSKAFLLAFSQSLHHELADKGVRVQVVLPGATATDFWHLSGLPVEHLPQGIVMSAEAMVDASLAGLAQGEVVTIPALPDIAEWDAFEHARKAMAPGLSRAQPAQRYLGGPDRRTRCSRPAWRSALAGHGRYSASSLARNGAVLLPWRGPPGVAYPSPRWRRPRRLRPGRRQSPSRPVRRNACRARSSPRCFPRPPAAATAPAACLRPTHASRWWVRPAHRACDRAGCAAARSPA